MMIPSSENSERTSSPASKTTMKVQTAHRFHAMLLLLLLLAGDVATNPGPTENFAKLNVILDVLWDARTKWYVFGLALGVDETTLDAINGKDDDTCFRMMISKWLKMAYPRPSWEALVKALCSPSVGRRDIAEEIAEKYGVSLVNTPLGGKEITQEASKRKTDELEEAATDTLPAASNTKTKSSQRNHIALLPQEYRKDLQLQLELNLEEILDYFDDYTSALQEILEERGVEAKALSEYLSGLPSLVCDPDDPKLALLSPSRRDKLDKATTISKIFAILKTECTSFFNYHIFERLMRKFQIKRGQDERLNYSEKLTTYIEKHRISEFIELEPILGELEDKTKLVLVLDIDTMSRLAQLMDIEKAVGKIMGLKPSALLIHDIKEACVIVTFLITIPLAEFIFTSEHNVFTNEQTKEFQKLSVIRLECNGYTYEFGRELATADMETAEVEVLNCSNATITETETAKTAVALEKAGTVFKELRRTQSLMLLKHSSTTSKLVRRTSLPLFHSTHHHHDHQCHHHMGDHTHTSSSSLQSYSDQQPPQNTGVTNSQAAGTNPRQAGSIHEVLPVPLERSEEPVEKEETEAQNTSTFSCPFYGEVETVGLIKSESGELGMLICGHKLFSGAYVKDVVEGKPAQQNGHISVGDKILSANGEDTSEASHNYVIQILKKCSDAVTLEIQHVDVSRTLQDSFASALETEPIKWSILDRHLSDIEKYLHLWPFLRMDILSVDQLLDIHDPPVWSAKLLVQKIQERGCIQEFLQALEESSAEFERHKILVQILQQDDHYEYIMKINGSVFQLKAQLSSVSKVMEPALLVVNSKGLSLRSIEPSHEELMFWPIGSIEQYRASNAYFIITIKSTLEERKVVFCTSNGIPILECLAKHKINIGRLPEEMNCLEQFSSTLPNSTTMEFFDFSRSYSWKKRLRHKLKKIRPHFRRRNSHIERHPMESHEFLKTAAQNSCFYVMPQTRDFSGLSGESGQIPGVLKMPTDRFDSSLQPPSATTDYHGGVLNPKLQASSVSSGYRSSVSTLRKSRRIISDYSSVSSGYRSASTLSKSLRVTSDYQSPSNSSDFLLWSASNPRVIIQAQSTSSPNSSSSSLQQQGADLTFTEEMNHSTTSAEARRRPHHSNVPCLDPIIEVFPPPPRLRDTSKGISHTISIVRPKGKAATPGGFVVPLSSQFQGQLHHTSNGSRLNDNKTATKLLEGSKSGGVHGTRDTCV